MKEMVTEEQRADWGVDTWETHPRLFPHCIKIKPDLGIIKDTHCNFAALKFTLKVFTLIYWPYPGQVLLCKLCLNLTLTWCWWGSLFLILPTHILAPTWWVLLLMTPLPIGAHSGQWNSISRLGQTGLLLNMCCFFSSFLFPAVALCLLCVLRSKKLMCWKAGSCLPELIEIMWMPFVLNPSGCAIKRRDSAAPEVRWEDLWGFTLPRFVCWKRERQKKTRWALDNWQPNQNVSHNLIRLQWKSLFIVGLWCREGEGVWES